MKRDDILEARKLTTKALEKKVADLQRDLVEIKLKAKRGEVANIRKAKMIRKDIAVLKTIIREKELIKNLTKKDKENK